MFPACSRMVMKCWVAWKAFSTVLPNRAVACGSWFGEHNPTPFPVVSPQVICCTSRVAVTYSGDAKGSRAQEDYPDRDATAQVFAATRVR